MEEVEVEGTSATAEVEQDEDEDGNEYGRGDRGYHDSYGSSSVMQVRIEDENDFPRFQLRQQQSIPHQSKTSSSSLTDSKKTSNLRSTSPNPSSQTPTTNRFNINSSTNNTNVDRSARTRTANIHKNQTLIRTHALKTRISVVCISVEVVAQRLMEAVHGGWVEELWRGVGVVVDLVESCESDQEGEAEGDGGGCGWVGKERNGEEDGEEEWL